MTTMLSDEFGNPLPAKCRHLRRNRTPLPDGGWSCACGKVVLGERARKGRQMRNYGNRAELTAAKIYGGKKIGHAGGPSDIRGKNWETQMKTHRREVPKEWRDSFAGLEDQRGRRSPRLLLRYVGKPGHPSQDYFVVPGHIWLEVFGKDEDEDE